MVRFGFVPRGAERAKETSLSIKRFAIALVKYGLLAVALVVTAGLSALTTMRVVLRTQEVVVPSLVGKPLPEAGALAARRRLVLRVEGRRNDPKLGRDLVGFEVRQSGHLLFILLSYSSPPLGGEARRGGIESSCNPLS